VTATILRGVCSGVTLELSATLSGDEDLLTDRVAAAMNAAVESAQKVLLGATVSEGASALHVDGTDIES
jgi:DNA-binding protein YbaB